MASLRETIHIDAPPEKVWATVREPLGLVDWFEGIDGAEMSGTARVVRMGEISVTEEIVTVDDDLRRFQYAITEMPIPIELHLATIDVLPDGDGTLLVYSAEVKPDELAPIIGPTLSGASAALKKHIES